MTAKIAALVVTYNRKVLLLRCLKALFSQTRQPDAVYVIDNASTDGTDVWLEKHGCLQHPALIYRRLRENGGGAGGFRAGIAQAVNDGCDWIWLMDDDAEPETGALQALEGIGLEMDCCYGSSAVFVAEDGMDYLCWPAVELGGRAGQERRFRKHSELPVTLCVNSLPFLGFMVNRTIVERVGLPEAGYFVSGDDVDYGERIKKASSSLVLVKASRIRHPRPGDYTVRFLGRSFFCLRLPPWRRYYDIRNRVLNGRRHFGFRLLFMTLPGVFVRWGATLQREPGRGRQSVAYARGIFDGLCNRLGKRWEPGS